MRALVVVKLSVLVLQGTGTRANVSDPRSFFQAIPLAINNPALNQVMTLCPLKTKSGIP
ncbi:hypothetical protein PISMIDRAFT_682893 [Pisolithus microcarpus 441]|uniref:Secreted protein n=1 Tax=Pisolithus microcarpus 441 TaxID=765257 RepID=A0A0C9YSF0_9AGAM|nr:hypothetical protein PISMIDRAFT_682893 [Pisolithus microcarpus 441]